MKYLLKIPGIAPKTIENIVPEVVKARLPAGATLEPVIEQDPSEPVFTAMKKKIDERPAPPEPMREDEALGIALDVQIKFFPALNDTIVNLTFEYRWKKSWLGTSYYRGRKIVLSKKLLCEKKKFYEQVVFHELCHLEFPGQGHSGADFRRKEKQNPYREHVTNCLRYVS